MKRTKIIRGIPAPLFDRIVEGQNGEDFGNRLLDAQALKDSIIQELTVILNTRCTVRKVIYEDHIETIPFFGLPDFFGLGDFSYFDASNSEEWPTAARFIETTIRAAEPRIRDVYVTIEGFDSFEQTLSISISASLKESTLLKEIHFPLVLRNWKSSHRKAVA